MKKILLVFLLLIIASTSFGAKYDRKAHFGSGWIDADRDCQNTRQEVLIEESLEPVVLDSRGCKVLSGYWICQFTGKIFRDPRKLDVDHLVPLKEAWISGAENWTKAKRVAYANDLDNPKHLIAVSAGSNRSKGAKDPGEWIPPKNRVLYVIDWMQVKKNYNLTYNDAEVKKIISTILIGDVPRSHEQTRIK